MRIVQQSPSQKFRHIPQLTGYCKGTHGGHLQDLAEYGEDVINSGKQKYSLNTEHDENRI
jgi:hypothetical protein